MAKTDKADKLVGGAKVKTDKIQWHVMVNGIGLTGYSPDARSAALDANAARQALTDAIEADKAIKSAGEHGSLPGHAHEAAGKPPAK